MSQDAVLDLMAREDLGLAVVVRQEGPRIKRAATLLAKALEGRGRIFYVGAGTSGRLGVLEAAECPPTYGTRPEQIVAIMAGGDRSVFRSKEGAEDSGSDAERALEKRSISRADVVVGLSASGVTPFVRSALGVARLKGASTVLVTCGPRGTRAADVVVALPVGAEVLAGSTRMKAATATKMALNQMTLLAMIRLKKVHGPYMIDVIPSSAKLGARAIRIVAAIAAISRERAETLFEQGGDVKTAVVMSRLDCSKTRARARLRAAGGSLRRALRS